MENRLPKTKTVPLPRSKNRRPTLTNARAQLPVDTVADENKDAFLGRREGIKNSYRQKDLNADVTDVLAARLQR